MAFQRGPKLCYNKATQISQPDRLTGWAVAFCPTHLTPRAITSAVVNVANDHCCSSEKSPGHIPKYSVLATLSNNQ